MLAQKNIANRMGTDKIFPCLSAKTEPGFHGAIFSGRIAGISTCAASRKGAILKAVRCGKDSRPNRFRQSSRLTAACPCREALRCRVRYFSDGLVLGSQAFVDSIFVRYRSQFGQNRKSGARPLRFGDWQGLCSLRDLRLLPVSKS